MPLHFDAAIAPIQSAIMAEGGSGGSVRLRLDAYGVDLNELLSYRGKSLKISIEIVDQTGPQ